MAQVESSQVVESVQIRDGTLTCTSAAYTMYTPTVIIIIIIIIIIIKTLGVFNTSARQLLCDFGRKISENTGEVRETSFLFQRCSGLVQRFNAILLHDSLPAYHCTD